MTCGGMRTILAKGKVVATYTRVEIDGTSRAMTRSVLSQLQEDVVPSSIVYYHKCDSTALANVSTRAATQM